jgi:hypothetical protein
MSISNLKFEISNHDSRTVGETSTSRLARGFHEVRITIHELRRTIRDSQFTNHKLRFTNHESRVTDEDPVSAWTTFQVWWRGLLAAAIAGGANGVITGFAAVGIDPQHFNLQAGLRSTLAIAAVSAMMSAIIGVAAYLKQSPLPQGE